MALLALIVAGAVAAAAILGVPGIRITTVEELERPAPAVSAPASDVDRAERRAGSRHRDVPGRCSRSRGDAGASLRSTQRSGLPTRSSWTARLAGGMVSMIWTARPGLPAADETGLAVLISQFDGAVNADGFVKLRDQEVQVEPVSVAGSQGLVAPWSDAPVPATPGDGR